MPRSIRHVPRRALLLLVNGYRLLVSPMLRASCRYAPSCSAYAVDALTLHGAAAGTYLAAARVLRCHPFCAGGFDPVPAHPPAFFRHLLFRHPSSVDPSPRPATDAPSPTPRSSP